MGESFSFDVQSLGEQDKLDRINCGSSLPVTSLLADFFCLKNDRRNNVNVTRQPENTAVESVCGYAESCIDFTVPSNAINSYRSGICK